METRWKQDNYLNGDNINVIFGKNGFLEIGKVSFQLLLIIHHNRNREAREYFEYCLSQGIVSYIHRQTFNNMLMLLVRKKLIHQKKHADNSRTPRTFHISLLGKELINVIRHLYRINQTMDGE